MKKIFLLILTVPFFVFTQSNNISDTLTGAGYYNSTLNASVDTADIVPAGMNSKKFDFISIVASSSATDTVEVYTLARDGATWTQKSVIGLSDDTVRTVIALTTTSKEFLINDPQPLKIRLINLSDDASTVTFLVQGKYGER